jgi:hypothetical protein
MGRPIKKTFFGNLNTPDGSSVELGSGVGGEGIAAITVAAAGSGYRTTSTSITFGAPQITGGSTATGYVTVNGGGTIDSVTITDPGAGYLNTSSIFTLNATFGSSATLVASLTTTVTNALAINSYIVGGSQRTNGDIIKQEASRRYLVQNADGRGQCILATTSTLTAGTMNLIATDSLTSTYFVSKLTAHRANLTRYLDGGSGFEYTDGAVAGWNITTPTTGTVSIAHTI